MLRRDAIRHGYRPAQRRAFTLVELMIVVAIVGVLAALGLVGFRRYLNASHSSEAVNMIGSIKAAQESYRSETLSYLNVSTSLNSFYPLQEPTDKRAAWDFPSGDGYANWRRLNVQNDGAVLYSYATIAGLPGTGVTTEGINVPVPTFPNPVEPWYLIQAKGNVDGDSTFMYALATSFSSGVFIENDDE